MNCYDLPLPDRAQALQAMNTARLSTQRGEARPGVVLLLTMSLAAAWLLWSGLYKPLLLGLGVFSCLLSVLLAYRMGFFHLNGIFEVIPRLPRYWLWLLREIISSSYDVARLIMQPSLPISPTVVELEAVSRSEVSQVILANAITLSPGTVTLDVHEGRLLVHCITRAAADALLEGTAVEKTTALKLD